MRTDCFMRWWLVRSYSHNDEVVDRDPQHMLVLGRAPAREHWFVGW